MFSPFDQSSMGLKRGNQSLSILSYNQYLYLPNPYQIDRAQLSLLGRSPLCTFRRNCIISPLQCLGESLLSAIPPRTMSIIHIETPPHGQRLSPHWSSHLHLIGIPRLQTDHCLNTRRLTRQSPNPRKGRRMRRQNVRGPALGCPF